MRNSSWFHMFSRIGFKSILYPLQLVLLLSVPLDRLMASGAEVRLLLRNGTVVTGELLAVNRTMLLLAPKAGMKEEKLKNDSTLVQKYTREEIEGMVVEGRSYLLDGVAFGLLGGVCIGVLIAFDPSGQGNPVSFGGGADPVGPGANAVIYTTLGGMAVGAFLGAVQSTDDRSITLGGAGSLLLFEDEARYQKDSRYKPPIPDFLRIILDPREKTE